ncbi:unnamed protein product [Prunus armeniaca]|uniref:Inositol polyphosphate multikinase n=1 Tax=Prunus armeniaca TaxID=36596 RepID=A0A6J5XFB3_PRUAR|nr:unnamed protein product [Prunus armeniaca]
MVPQAAEDYIIKCLKKDRETIYRFWKPDKKCVLNFSIEDTRLALRKFVSSNPSTDSDIKPDCSFASTVYGGPAGILAQLLELKSWSEEQTIFHFYSCSAMMVYEKESILQGRNSGAEIKLIDFARVIQGKGVIDHNFLGGLCSLIKLISDIVTSPSA